MTDSPKITVYIPGPLRQYCAGKPEFSVSAATVRGVLDDLERDNPTLHVNIRDETGAVRRHLNVFVNLDNVRNLQGLDTPLAPGDVVTILTSVSGG